MKGKIYYGLKKIINMRVYISYEYNFVNNAKTKLSLSI